MNDFKGKILTDRVLTGLKGKWRGNKMGSCYPEYESPPCANCGKPNGGHMGSTAWRHEYGCCSNRCGFRLKKRIENGMYHPSPFNLVFDIDHRTEFNLRVRIKQLEHKIRQHIKGGRP